MWLLKDDHLFWLISLRKGVWVALVTVWTLRKTSEGPYGTLEGSLSQHCTFLLGQSLLELLLWETGCHRVRTQLDGKPRITAWLAARFGCLADSNLHECPAIRLSPLSFARPLGLCLPKSTAFACTWPQLPELPKAEPPVESIQSTDLLTQ